MPLIPLSRTLLHIKAYPAKVKYRLASVTSFDLDSIFPHLQTAKYAHQHRVLWQSKTSLLTLIVCYPKDEFPPKEYTGLELDGLVLHEASGADRVIYVKPEGKDDCGFLVAANSRGALFATRTDFEHLAERKAALTEYINSVGIPFNPEVVEERRPNELQMTKWMQIFTTVRNLHPTLPSLLFSSCVMAFAVLLALWGFLHVKNAELERLHSSNEKTLRDMRKDLKIEGMTTTVLKFAGEKTDRKEARHLLFSEIEAALPAGASLKEIRLADNVLQVSFTSADKDMLFRVRDAVSRKNKAAKWGDLSKGQGANYELSMSLGLSAE